MKKEVWGIESLRLPFFCFALLMCFHLLPACPQSPAGHALCQIAIYLPVSLFLSSMA